MTLPPARQSAFNTAPMNELLSVLLRQFKRPLANFDVDLTPQAVTDISEQIAQRQPLTDAAMTIRDGLIQVVVESEAWFSDHDLTFQKSLQTEMGDMPGWETTAEFLDLANEKSNAELRVAGASALVLALGDRQYADYLLFLLENPQLDDVNAIMAKRILAFASQTESQMDDDDWLAAVRAWIDQAE